MKDKKNQVARIPELSIIQRQKVSDDKYLRVKAIEASHSFKPKFSRYTQFQHDFIVISVSDARCRNPLVMAPIPVILQVACVLA
ncbi:hypothetical protein, partial [Klebsiella pneumoniae]|uniref:hypothetical protein n=1 Tax=Klebsiella pneumoniae TaxID=573 RepID=UPI00101163D7